MDRLKNMKEQMVSVVQSQMGNLECVDAKELGEAVDMIKDLAEAIYYCSITDAMEESEKDKSVANNYYYTQPMMDNRQDYNMGRMYYGGGNSGNGNSGSSNSGNSSSYYTPRMPYYMEDPMQMNNSYMMPNHDYREGRSYSSRRGYMESKDLHKDSATQMRELEKYIRDLGEDLTEMVERATPEEKQVLQQKIATLATKIS